MNLLYLHGRKSIRTISQISRNFHDGKLLSQSSRFLCRSSSIFHLPSKTVQHQNLHLNQNTVPHWNSRFLSSTTTTSVSAPSEKNEKNEKQREEENERNHQIRIAKALAKRVWPQGVVGDPQSQIHAAQMRRRVMYSLGLMVGAKAVTVQVPFLFKYLVDTLPVDASNAAAMEIADVSSVAPALPVAALLGYGISRATASGKLFQSKSPCYVILLLL